jgi:hypothetical protein
MRTRAGKNLILSTINGQFPGDADLASYAISLRRTNEISPSSPTRARGTALTSSHHSDESRIHVRCSGFRDVAFRAL